MLTDNKDKKLKSIYGLLGLAMRAGDMITGQEACVTTIRKQAAALVLMDEATASNGQKKIRDACKYHGIPLALLPPGEISFATGKSNRTVVAVAKGALGKTIVQKAQEANILFSCENTNCNKGLVGGQKIDE